MSETENQSQPEDNETIEHPTENISDENSEIEKNTDSANNDSDDHKATNENDAIDTNEENHDSNTNETKSNSEDISQPEQKDEQKDNFFENAFSDNQNTADTGSFQFNFGDFPTNDGQDNNGGDGSFQFSFNDFPSGNDGQANASFTFDANDAIPIASEEDKLYDKFISLINNPCFDYTGRPLIEYFKHEDPTDSAAAAFSLLVGNK